MVQADRKQWVQLKIAAPELIYTDRDPKPELSTTNSAISGTEHDKNDRKFRQNLNLF